MSDVAEVKTERLDVALPIEDIEGAMLELPQVACPVAHHFGPGVYMREVSMTAGTLAVGHRQKHEHLNVMIKGRVLMFNDDGSTTELAAPLTFTGKPGRKVGLILEDMVWLNIYSTDERNIDALEATFLDKSSTWAASDAQRHALDVVDRQDDRDDYQRVLDESGFTHETALAQSTNTDDMSGEALSGVVQIRKSAIDGLGLFVSAPFAQGQVIATARISGKRTAAGRYTNHSASPNARMVLHESGDIDLVATCPLDGCSGGQQGQEVTIDYRQALGLSGISFAKGTP